MNTTNNSDSPWVDLEKILIELSETVQTKSFVFWAEKTINHTQLAKFIYEAEQEAKQKILQKMNEARDEGICWAVENRHKPELVYELTAITHRYADKGKQIAAKLLAELESKGE